MASLHSQYLDTLREYLRKKLDTSFKDSKYNIDLLHILPFKAFAISTTFLRQPISRLPFSRGTHYLE